MTRSVRASSSRQLLTITRIMLAEYRGSWFLHLFFGSVLPLGMAFAFKAVLGEVGRERALYMLGGSMASSVALGPAALLITRLGWGRHNREFVYWATLPVAKVKVVLAMVAINFLFALPGIAASYLSCRALFGVTPDAGPALWALLPLVTLSVTGFAATLGSFARNAHTATALSNAFIALTTFLSPLMLPLEALPSPLQWLSTAVPTTYAARALRAALGSGGGAEILEPAAVLTGFAVVSLALMYRWLDWRE